MKIVFRNIPIVATLGALGILLYLRYSMAVTQHFDLDEYAYLHWAAHTAQGFQPMRDFFFILPPGFLWFLVPVFILFPNGLDPIFAARFMELGAFMLLAGAVAMLFFQQKKSYVALLVPVLLFFLPFPNIKFTEIRPDTLGMAFVVLAMLNVGSHAFLAGLLYALSIFIMPKMAPAALVGLAFLHHRWKSALAGFGIVLLGGVMWLLATGGWDLVTKAWYLIVGIPLETNATLGTAYPIPLDFFFKPNAFFYGVGSDIGRITNHVLWAIAAVIGLWRILLRKDLLIALTCIAQLATLLLVSTHHAQYFIPLAVWVTWYVADGINELRILMKPKIFVIVYTVFLVFVALVAVFVTRTRWALPMTDTFNLVTTMWENVPKNEYVFDLEGITLYYKDPYYVCCLPFGQTQDALSRPFPELSSVLEKTRTKYIYQGFSHRTNTLTTRDQLYVSEHFAPWQGHEELLVRIF